MKNLLSTLFKEGSPNKLAIARIVIFGSALVMSWDYTPFTDFYSATEGEWSPIGVFKIISDPLSPQLLMAIKWLWFGVMTSAMLGVFPAISTKLAFFSSLILFGYSSNFGTISHSKNLILLFMGVLSLSRCGDAFALWSCRQKTHVDRFIYVWPFALLNTLAALYYFGAGYQKLIRTGWSWASADNQAAILLGTVSTSPFGYWLLQNWPSFFSFIGVYVLLIEILSPLTLINSYLRAIFIINWIMFHLGTYWILQLKSFLICIPCLVAIFPWHLFSGYLLFEKNISGSVAEGGENHSSCP